MSNNNDDVIILKNNQTTGIVPAADELVLGEVAINTADGIIYTKKNDGSIVAVGVAESGSSLVQSVAGRIGNVVLTKSDVGLNSVDNTSDINKPVSAAQAAADIAIQNAAAQDATTKSDAAKAYAIQRTNHTGTQPSSSISDFASAVSTASPVKSVAGKTGVVALTKQDVGLNNVDNTSDNNKPVSTAQAAADTAVLVAAETLATEKANNAQLYSIQRANHTGTQPISTVTGLQTALNNKADSVHNHDDRYYTESEVNSLLAAKQASGNYATLVGGLVPAYQLPSYVDDILEYTTLEAFPATGETGKIYVAQNNNKTYRWGGSSYIEISASPGSTDSVPEGASNLYYTDARVQLAAPVKSVSGRVGDVVLTKVDVGLSNIDNTSDLDKPISTQMQTALNAKSPVDHTHSNNKYNTYIGNNSLVVITTAERNTSIGYDTLSNLSSGFGNTAVGSGAAYSATTGSFNTAIGTFSQISSVTASDNNSLGYGSLGSNTTGIGNCAFGTNSLVFNTTGLHNIAIGYEALKDNTTGSFNIAIGLLAGTNSASLQNCICLGTRATASNSGEFVIGSATNPINISSNVGATGAASALPTLPLGYIQLRLNGILVKIPYYRN